MLAIEAGSALDATTPSMPATATDALPAAGQVTAAGGAAIGCTWTASTVGLTACSGQRRVVAGVAADQERCDADRNQHARTQRRPARRVAEQLRTDRDVGRRRDLQAAGRNRGDDDRRFVDPPECHATRGGCRACRREGRRRGGAQRCDAHRGRRRADVRRRRGGRGGRGCCHLGHGAGDVEGRAVSLGTTGQHVAQTVGLRLIGLRPVGAARRTPRGRRGVIQCHLPKLPPLVRRILIGSTRESGVPG